MKRSFDLFVATILSVLLAIPMFIIWVLIKFTSKGPALFWSNRVGVHNRIFRMPKFRTMRVDTPDIATHLLHDPDAYLISTGRFLRKYSLDEFPQIWSVLKGDMSLVGPRPALHNQDDLIELRTSRGLHNIVPGVTGWAQVNGRDIISIPTKVEYDEYYMLHQSFSFDLKILWITFLKVIKKENIQH
jgi:O-antigen biosynthesis protein WbqP